MKARTSCFFGFVLLAMAGCGSGSSATGDPPQPAQGLLTPVASAAALEALLKGGLTAMANPEQLAVADTAASTSAGTGNYTGTYTQEMNVDELDAVRYDGEHLYVAPRRYFHCCFILAEAGSPVDAARPEPERSIRILATDPANGDAGVVSTIPLEDGVSVQGMYVEEDRLFALTARATYGLYGALWTDLAIWAPDDMGFQLYDISDKANPSLEIEAMIDGVFVESRRIGNMVYVVSRYTPWIEGLHYSVQTPEQQAENEALLASATLDDLLPKITISGETQQLVTPENCYVTTGENQPYAVITSITAIPLDDPNNFTTACYNESAYGAYVSESAFYFTELRHDQAFESNITRVHKFALAGTSVSYRGSADIDGVVWRGGQADFRMSEHNGDLRLMASQFDWSNDDFVDHQLFILRESSTRPDLDIVSMLPNDSRPAEIGKPNESLYGVRFLGDTVYAVTFEQIDPLYAIDLSNPDDPFIAGELQVTGVSDFLHPVNEALLLGLGRSEQGALKLELFDVSNIAQPLSRGSSTIGGSGSYSEALYDRHAFTYQADINGVDRLAIPAQIYGVDNSWQFEGSELHLFEILDKNTPSLAALNRVGVIAPLPANPESPDWVERSRSFLHGDTVYYIRDEEVWAAFWQSPSLMNGPF